MEEREEGEKEKKKESSVHMIGLSSYCNPEMPYLLFESYLFLEPHL